MTDQPEKKAKTPRKHLQVGALCRDAQGRVLLITSRGTGRWVIPKGWTMPGLTHAEAALREAWEEAGVEGTIGSDPVGEYRYEKGSRNGRPKAVSVQVFAASVERLAEDWPEAKQRRRAWFTPAEAAGLVAEPDLQTMLRSLT